MSSQINYRNQKTDPDAEAEKTEVFTSYLGSLYSVYQSNEVHPNLFPVKISLFPKTKKLCTSRPWKMLSKP